jgi:hypothetical protein
MRSNPHSRASLPTFPDDREAPHAGGTSEEKSLIFFAEGLDRISDNRHVGQIT